MDMLDYPLRYVEVSHFAYPTTAKIFTGQPKGMTTEPIKGLYIQKYYKYTLLLFLWYYNFVKPYHDFTAVSKLPDCGMSGCR